MKETDRELLERIAGTLGDCRDSLKWIAEMFNEYMDAKVRDKPKKKELTSEEKETEKEYFGD